MLNIVSSLSARSIITQMMLQMMMRPRNIFLVEEVAYFNPLQSVGSALLLEICCLSSAVQLIMQMVLNRGDTFLVEEFAYSHLLEGVAEPKGFVPLPVPIDEHGMVPAGLRQVKIMGVHLSCLKAPPSAGADRRARHAAVRPQTGEDIKHAWKVSNIWAKCLI